jgi:hypothetical protein
MFNRSTDDQIEFQKYDINIDLEESSSNEEKTILKYSLDLTSNPKNSVINISGNTILSGEPEEIEDFLKQEDEKTPEVVSLIYQELFPLMYIISKNMNIPSPAHTISQNNVKEFDKQEKIPVDSNEKTLDTQPNQVIDKAENSNQSIPESEESKTNSNEELGEEKQNDDKKTQ